MKAAVLALTVSGGAGGPEASDEALNTIINELAARAGSDAFTGSWRPEAIKLIILLTDALPGGFDDTHTVGVDDVNADTRADEAAADDILIGAVQVGTSSGVQAIMQNYATKTGGQYFQTSSTGEATAEAFEQILLNLPTDLMIEKSATPDVYAGEEVLYTITVTNNGPGDAQNVVVTDTMPPHVEFLADDLNAATVTGGDVLTGYTLEIDLGQILCGYSKTVVLKGRVTADAVILEQGVFTALNTATVDASNPETIPDNDTASAGAFVQECADLRIAKVSKPDTVVQAGEEFTYTIYVDNYGPSFAHGVYLTDDIVSSGAFTVQGIDMDQARIDWSSVTPATPPQSGFLIEAGLADPLEPVGFQFMATGRWRIQINVVANETQDVDNMAQVYTTPTDYEVTWDTGTPDPDMSNNVATDFISVLDTADLALTKTADPEPVDAGGELTYTLTVTNNGPSTATNVVIEDVLPAEVEILSLEGTKADSTPAGCVAGTPGDPFDPTCCFVGTLLDGQSGSMEIVVRVKPDIAVNLLLEETLIQNDACTYSDEHDPDTSNNCATTNTTVDSVADLSVLKTDEPDPVVAGELLEYEIVFMNHGPGLARDVALVDVFPPELEIISAVVFDVFFKSSTPADCVLLPDRAICEIGDIQPGDGGTLIIVGRVAQDTPDTVITNEVEIVSDTADPDETNNIDTEDTTVVACALPAKPTNLVATNGLHIKTVVVTWDTVLTATAYRVYRHTVPDYDSSTLLATVSVEEYLDYQPEYAYVTTTGCSKPDPTIFYYWVVAGNDCGFSEPSDPDEGYENALKSAGGLLPVSWFGDLALLGGAFGAVCAGIRRRRKRR